jgi:hypothetical protein
MTDTKEAKAVLKDAANAPAAALITAVRALYKDDVLEWEPEALWLSLEREGIVLHNPERDKIQAAITLIKKPSFYWDNLVFQRTVQSLNDQPFSMDVIQETHTAHMAWAIFEASVIRNMDPDEQTVPEFDEDVQQYAAVCMFREGLVLPPENLKFAEDSLDKLQPQDAHATGLKKEVSQAWGHLNKGKLEHTEFAENSVGVQLARLASSYLYVKDRAGHLANVLIRLSVKLT